MKILLRVLTVFLIALACGVLSGCQFDLKGFDRAGQEAITRTPFQPILPTKTSTPEALITTGTATPSPTPVFTATPEQCPETPGRIEEKEVTFTPGSEPFHFRVYLPPCFDSGKGAPYPVLYMIHGQTYSDDQWQRLGIGEAADTMITKLDAPSFIIIMPREPDTYEDIYLASFSSDVTGHLIPWVDETYPTCDRRECRSIGGLSRGGAWALYLGFKRWELFGAIGAHSTPPFTTTPREFPVWVEQIPERSLPHVYMDIGRSDPYLSLASAFEEQLVAYGIPHEWYLFNGTHDEAYWSSHVSDYLAWYTQAWKKP